MAFEQISGIKPYEEMFLKKPYKKGQFLVVKSIAWFPEIDHFKPSL